MCNFDETEYSGTPTQMLLEEYYCQFYLSLHLIILKACSLSCHCTIYRKFGSLSLDIDV